ncbi:hypothetical protein Vadar_007172 [Vaccinium darrowii]|uniref:Uncharacterized protein n=1 Tax=Vaccinium darrowii TaxID=229202 RepID=A0ACB7X8J4_9ERIC|nr:hypothetical protein Vadar_007172 [Vaccinium darrowii]
MNSISSTFRSTLVFTSVKLRCFSAVSSPNSTTTQDLTLVPTRKKGVSSSKNGRGGVRVSDSQLKEKWLDSLTCPFPEDLLRPNCGVSGVLRSDLDSRWVIGVDPDVSGALALLKNDDLGCSPQVFDSPHLQLLVGKRTRRRLDAKSIVQLLRSIDAPVGYDQGQNDEPSRSSAENSGPTTEPHAEPSTFLAQTLPRAQPAVQALRRNTRQRQGRGRSSGQRRGRGPTGSNSYRAFFASEDALRDFRESFQIPADVELELIPLDPSTHRLPQRHETVVPIFAICAAGLRFPIQTFTRQFLHVLDVTPEQLEWSIENVVNLFSTYGLPITSLPDSDKYANDFVFTRPLLPLGNATPTGRGLKLSSVSKTEQLQRSLVTCRITTQPLINGGGKDVLNSLLPKKGVPSTPVTTNSQTQAPSNTDAQPTVSEQERRKRRRAIDAEESRNEASSNLGDSNIGQSSLSGNEAENLNRTEALAENQNVDDIPWAPRLSYCNRPLKQTDSIRDNPGLSLALLKAVELPKDKARVEKEAGDAFVLASTIRLQDGLQERNKLLLGFEKKVKALTDENARLKEENTKAKTDASSALRDAAESKKALEGAQPKICRSNAKSRLSRGGQNT